MKTQGTTEAKRAAANDKQENDKAEKAKGTTSLRTEPPASERYTIGSTETVKRGFLKEFCDFTRKKGTVDAAMLIAEFAGDKSMDTKSMPLVSTDTSATPSTMAGQFKKAK